MREFEEPVALIQSESDVFFVTLVSKWKKGSVNLDDYLSDRKISANRKIRMHPVNAMLIKNELMAHYDRVFNAPKKEKRKK